VIYLMFMIFEFLHYCFVENDITLYSSFSKIKTSLKHIFFVSGVCVRLIFKYHINYRFCTNSVTIFLAVST